MKTANEQTKNRIGMLVNDYGEILDEFYDGDRIVRKKQATYNNNHIINFNKDVTFVKVFPNQIPILLKELSTKEFATVMSLMLFVSYNDCILRCDGKIATGKMISDILEEKYETFKKTLASLIKKEIIKKIQMPSETCKTKTRNCLVVNPYIYIKGQDINKDILNVFDKSKWNNVKAE